MCRVGVHHFLYQMCAFCTRIASLCPGSGDLQHHATARRRQKYSGLRRILFSSSLNPCELLLEATICFEAALALAVLYLIPLPMAATMCIITLCTIPLLCTIALARNTLAVLYLIQPQGRHRQQLEKKRCYARSTNITLTMSIVYKAHPCTYSQLCIV